VKELEESYFRSNSKALKQIDYLKKLILKEVNSFELVGRESDSTEDEIDDIKKEIKKIEDKIESLDRLIEEGAIENNEDISALLAEVAELSELQKTAEAKLPVLRSLRSLMRSAMHSEKAASLGEQRSLESQNAPQIYNGFGGSPYGNPYGNPYFNQYGNPFGTNLYGSGGYYNNPFNSLPQTSSGI
jgi:hypothetical protein